MEMLVAPLVGAVSVGVPYTALVLAAAFGKWRTK